MNTHEFYLVGPDFAMCENFNPQKFLALRYLQEKRLQFQLEVLTQSHLTYFAHTPIVHLSLLILVMRGSRTPWCSWWHWRPKWVHCNGWASFRRPPPPPCCRVAGWHGNTGSSRDRAAGGTVWGAFGALLEDHKPEKNMQSNRNKAWRLAHIHTYIHIVYTHTYYVWLGLS